MIFPHRNAGRTIGVENSLDAYGIIRHLLLLLVAALLTGARPEGSRTEPARDAALVLGEGIHELNNPSSDFRAVLRAMSSQLAANAALRTAILKFVERLPPTTDFKCSDDFLRTRARQELIRLQHAVLKTAGDRVEPQFCFTTPYVIDAGKPTDAVEIYGFDFDAAPIQMVLVSGGKYEDVSSALIKRSHYHLTLKLGRNGVALPAKTQTLGLTWGNLIHHSISVVTTDSPLCPTDIEVVSPSEPITYSPPAVSREMVAGRAGGKALASSALDYAGNAVYATICVTVTGPDDARATFSGCNREFIGTIDPDHEIERVLGRVESHAVFTPDSRSGIKNGTPRDPIATWRFVHPRTEAALQTTPFVTVKLRKIRVVSTRTGDCVSPIAFNEAKREGALRAATSRALDAKLRPLNPSLIGLRPRFAPPMHPSDR